jgi:hypothetical protein
MVLTPNEKVPTRERWHEQIRKRYENAKTMYFGFISGYSHPKLVVHIFQQ